MNETDLKAMFLIPIVLAVVFMLWVIWRLELEIRREKRRSEANARAREGGIHVLSK